MDLDYRRARFENLKSRLKVGELMARQSVLEQEISRPDFWRDPTRARLAMKALSELQEIISEVKAIEDNLNLADEAVDRQLDLLELKTLLSGAFDPKDALLSIHSGQGGTEAMDWAQMLKRMYERYAQSHNYSVVVIDESMGEEAGIKSAVMEIKGPYAYGYLKNEAGVHRLVRQSPFNANNLRQTSFAMVEVIPLLEGEADVEINEAELTIETFRSSGHGGQNVQKVETAVRIRHKPTGIIVTSQTQRYQAQNREIALRVLKSKLIARQHEERRAQEEKLKGVYKVPGWGNQIRSYVLHPYKMVKDLRTGLESGDPQKVLDGTLDDFIKAELLENKPDVS